MTSTSLTPYVGSYQNIEDILQTYSKSACASLKLKRFDKMAGLFTTTAPCFSFLMYNRYKLPSVCPSVHYVLLSERVWGGGGAF